MPGTFPTPSVRVGVPGIPVRRLEIPTTAKTLKTPNLAGSGGKYDFSAPRWDLSGVLRQVREGLLAVLVA